MSASQNNNQTKILLAVIEQGGYPDFTALYESVGYQVEMVKSPRKAISYLKKNAVDCLVAEFNFQHQAVNWGKERRYIVIRQNTMLRKKASGKQLSFFEELLDNNTYRHALYVTNNKNNTPYEVWNFYKPRANDENVIDNLKSGFGLDSFNLDNFWATEAVLMTITLIFHNLLHYLMLKVINPIHFRERLRSVRFKYFIIPGMLGTQVQIQNIM